MAKRTTDSSREAGSSAVPAFIYPAVSVIIPLYNAEPYIGECLASLLAQTFQNFEVIVVDDYSTDNSVKIVESYAPKFNGRLRLIKTRKNSGSGTEPRNLGFSYSRGEYVYFMDNDDAVTPTALEEMYSLAKKFDADVVHCEKYYEVPCEFSNTAEFRRQLKSFNFLTGEKILIKEPTLWTNNFEERIKFFAQRKLIWNFWVQLVRRDFIVKNSIKLVGILADDMPFTICELCCAERYLIVPNVVYLYRQRKDSLIHKRLEPEKLLNNWLSMLKVGIEYLDEFLSGREPFARLPDLKYILFNVFANEMLSHLVEIYKQVPAPVLDNVLRKEFKEDSAFTSFVFNTMNIYRLQLMQAYQRIAALENELKGLKESKNVP